MDDPHVMYILAEFDPKQQKEHDLDNNPPLILAILNNNDEFNFNSAYLLWDYRGCYEDLESIDPVMKRVFFAYSPCSLLMKLDDVVSVGFLRSLTNSEQFLINCMDPRMI